MNFTRPNRGYFAVGLDQPKTHANVAHALRACGCYGASMMAISGHRYKPVSVDTMQHYRHMPLIQTDNLKSVVPCNCDVVAVELVEDSKSLIDFHHPERAFYVFGAEDQTLSDETLAWCKHRVSIPTRSCMNLAACVNVVLYDRMAKRNRAYV